MTYTNKEYAEMAIRANAEGKKLVDNNGTLELQDIVRTEEEITASNESLIKSLKLEAINEINILKYEDGNADKLAEWEAYYTALKEVDTSIEKIDLPEKPS